jgi:ketosteroid isomerase-like protein
MAATVAAAAARKEAMMGDDAAAIRRWLEEFSAAVRAVDYERGRTYFASDVVGFGTYASMLEGLDNLIAGQWRNIWGVTRGFTFRLEHLHLGISGDLAWVAVPWDSQGQHPDGTWYDRPGRATLILERREGRWLAVHSHLSLYPCPSA